MKGKGGITKDERRAIELFQKACDGGSMSACNNLGVAWEQGQGGFVKDDKRAVELYQKACDGGDARGCANFGWRLVVGQGIPMDRDRGIGFLRRACAAGIQWGCDKLTRLRVGR
jgi:TPR repeat protein